MCISVDLPDPDGPITAVSLPLITSTETPCSACTAVSPCAVAARDARAGDDRDRLRRLPLLLVLDDNCPHLELLQLGSRSVRSKKPITRRSYSAGSVVMPAMCWPFGTSQICFGSRAAA